MNGPMREDIVLSFRGENAEEATAAAMRWATVEPNVSSARLVQIEDHPRFATVWLITLEIRWKTPAAWFGVEATR
jgi:hypothetical protein